MLSTTNPPVNAETFKQYNSIIKDTLTKKLLKSTGSDKAWTPELCAEFRKVGIGDLLFNSYFLGSTLRKEDMYPAVLDTIYDIWNWINDKDREKLYYVVLLQAIGTGKTTCNTVLQWLQWYYLTTNWFDFRKDLHLIGNKPCAFIQMNVDASKARKVTFDSIYPLFENCAFNQEYFPIDKRVKSEIRIGRNNTIIFPGTGKAASALGYDIYAAGLDEMAKMRTIGDSTMGSNADGGYDVGKDMFDQIDQRIQSRFGYDNRGVMIMFTQRNTGREFVEQLASKIRTGQQKHAMLKEYNFWDAVGRNNPKHFISPKNVFINSKTYEVIEDDESIAQLRQRKKEIV